MPEMFCSEKDGMVYIYRSTSEYNPDAHSKRSKSKYVEQAFEVLRTIWVVADGAPLAKKRPKTVCW